MSTGCALGLGTCCSSLHGACLKAWHATDIRTLEKPSDHVPVLASATYTHSLLECFNVRARAGVISLFYTGDEDDEDLVRALTRAR